jgi:hypothetical protein
MPVKELRKALRYAEEMLGVDRLLLNRALCTQAGELFLDHYGQLISLSASGQLAMRKVFEQHLERVEWDLPIAIDPRVGFGRPIVVRRSPLT